MRSADLCSGSFEVTCPDDDFGAGYTNLQVSEFIVSPDARREISTLEYTVFDPDGAVICSSIYDVSKFVLHCD